MKVEFSRYHRAAPAPPTYCPHCTMFVQLIQPDPDSAARHCPICRHPPTLPRRGVSDSLVPRADDWLRETDS